MSAASGLGPPLLTAEALAVGYDGRPVVQGVSFTLEPGMTLALVGINGSGKSTLLKTIAGLLPPVAGSMSVFGERPGRFPTRVAYLGQFHPSEMILPLRVIDVVRMARFSSLGLLRWAGSADERRVRAAMEVMGVEALEDAPLKALSGGQRQRVFLAQALARDAELLLLDEPQTNLDAAGREVYKRVVREATQKGQTLVICTHDIAEASDSDRAMLLARRVVAYGAGCAVLTPDTLLSTFGLTAKLTDGQVTVVEREHRRECRE